MIEQIERNWLITCDGRRADNGNAVRCTSALDAMNSTFRDARCGENQMSMRKNPTMHEKLAATLLELQRLRGDRIEREHAKLMTADQICSLFQFDHAAGYVAHGAGNHPTMLTPMFIAPHREKTAKHDVPAIAKCKRLAADTAAFRSRMLAKSGQDIQKREGAVPHEKMRKNPIHSQGFQKSQRPLRSRNTLRKTCKSQAE